MNFFEHKYNRCVKKFRPTAYLLIKDNKYLRGNYPIYLGITMSHYSIIAPNSTVTKDVAQLTTVVGVPATFIKNIVLP